jgi:hypothetical protein
MSKAERGTEDEPDFNPGRRRFGMSPHASESPSDESEEEEEEEGKEESFSEPDPQLP